VSARRKRDPDQPGLYVVSGDEIIGRTPTVKELLDRNDELERQILDLEKERRQQRTVITRLKSELDTTPAHYDRADEVGEIFSEWRSICQHPNARLTLDRFHAIRRLLDVMHPRPYPREAFSLAIRGAAYDPFVKRMKNGRVHRYDDIELICRDGVHFEGFIRRAPR
jgi:hypothetical protein